MKRLGVDISEYQQGISFARLISEGVEFAILRGGDGSYKDKCFDGFYEEAKAHNLPVGAYWFSRAVTQEQARKEALRFYDRCLKGRKFELPVYMDVESNAQRNLGRDALTDIIQVWCDTLVDLGYCVGLYTSTSWLSSEVNFDRLTGVELWVAQWSRNQPSQPHGMWQFGGETNYLRDKHLAGMVVDQNYMFTDYPAFIKENGLNGFAKTETEEKEETEMRYQTIGEVPQWAQEETRELISSGALKGNEKGLDVTEDMLRTMIVNLRYTKAAMKQQEQR